VNGDSTPLLIRCSSKSVNIAVIPSRYGANVEPFEIAVIGVVLLAYSAASRRLMSSPITMPIVFVAAGAALSATGVVEVAQELEAIALLAEVALAVILFSDSTRLSIPKLRLNVGYPTRLLSVGLPLTVLLGTGVNMLLFGDWPPAEALLLAAILAPTDAALGQAVVSDPAVPARERLALNVESGLNDGLVVPVVAVATSLVIDMQRSVGSWFAFVGQQIGLGAAIGLITGIGGITLLRRTHAAGWSDGRYEQIATFGLPIMALTVADAAGGNGFIAAFVGGLAFGSGGLRAFGADRDSRRTDEAASAVGPEDDGPLAAERLAEFTEDAAELLAAVTFFVFGNLFVGDALGEFGPAVLAAAIASLTFVRMIPVFIALTGSGSDVSSKLFIGWFGPRGLASIVFAILLLEQLEEMSARADRLVGVISLTVTLSVVLHGATAAIGARHYGAHVERRNADGQGPGSSSAEATLHEEMMPRTRWSIRRQA